MINKKTTSQVNPKLVRLKSGIVKKGYLPIMKRIKYFRKLLEYIRKANIGLIAIIFYIATLGLVLKSMNLLQDFNKNLLQITGITLCIFIFLFITLFYLSRYNASILKHPRKFLIFCLINFCTLLLAHGILNINISQYSIPATLTGMLLASFVGGREALACLIILGGLLGFISNFSIDIVFTFIIMGGLASLSMPFIRKRIDLFKIGLASGVLGTVFITTWGLLQGWDIKTIFTQSSFGMGGALVSAFLALEILPFLENIFGKLNYVKLMELSQLNHPLLVNLREKAPGTYQSCLMVANLAEAAAEKINANPLLAKIGAYYHDIGKIKNPPYFVENLSLNSKSKHEKINPALSSLILISHVKEGVQLAEKYRLPKEIRDIISQHHGTTFTSFFYQEALKKDSNGKVEEESFRYPGPKPQSKEAAIVMLADTVEAASRTLDDPSPARIKNMVENLTKEKLIGRQLEESQLNFHDLKEIEKSFIQSLTGTFHGRIKYPSSEQTDAKKEKNDGNGHPYTNEKRS
ncbi:MAG: HDIG domain-containing protein [Candidatus Ratteibacteria bacterium]|nr:HDIG domain-containing protein [Candidatus Ratteibacteria bacterium]